MIDVDRLQWDFLKAVFGRLKCVHGMRCAHSAPSITSLHTPLPSMMGLHVTLQVVHNVPSSLQYRTGEYSDQPGRLVCAYPPLC